MPGINLEVLATKTIEAVKECVRNGIDPKNVVVLVSTNETASEEANRVEFEEFPDDNEDYRQHVRAGGKREFRFEISSDTP